MRSTFSTGRKGVGNMIYKKPTNNNRKPIGSNTKFKSAPTKYNNK